MHRYETKKKKRKKRKKEEEDKVEEVEVGKEKDGGLAV